MKLRATETIIVVMALVIVLLSWGLVYYSRDELGTQAQRHEEQIKAASGARVEDGRPVVHLSEQSQEAAGIVVEPLRSATHESAFEAYGMVLNLQTLAELRGRYLAAAAEARAAKATLDLAESEARRMEALYRDDRNVSEQAMQAAQARVRAERSRHSAADQAAAGIRETMRGAWGEAVMGWAVNPGSGMMRSLLEQKAFLVQLVLPHDLAPGSVHGRISVAPAMAREHARPASFVADSPQIDPALPGETYFYLVSGGGFRAGMRVAARIKLQGAALAGVIVPAAAVVWHAGKAWAYVKRDEDSFARFEVATSDELNGGWFNASGFEEDDEVVISGAQLLLSEELKYQIRNENED